MHPELQNIYKRIDDYLMLPDKKIVKLLCAFAISCKLPTAPPWLFIASGSSTGKTELISLLELTPGYYPVDDMTNNALLSGMKKHDKSASLLHRAPKEGGYLVFSDFTTMLSKRKEDLSAILGQLRVVFDGKANRATGGLESEVTWKGKLGLLAGCTTTLYTKTEEYSEVGQRMVIYHMEQPDNYKVAQFRFDHAKTDQGAVRKELQEMIASYVGSIEVPTTYADLPDFDKQTQADITDIGHLAVSARSPVSRNQHSHKKEIESIEDPEGIGRVQGQLMSLAYGLMLQNENKLLGDYDRQILYDLGLDCIDPRKRGVLKALTEFSLGGNAGQIANIIGYPKEVTQRFIDDLQGLRMIEDKSYSDAMGSRNHVYVLKDSFKDIMMRFEGIKVKDESLPDDENESVQDKALRLGRRSTDPIVPIVEDDSDEAKAIQAQIGF